MPSQGGHISQEKNWLERVNALFVNVSEQSASDCNGISFLVVRGPRDKDSDVLALDGSVGRWRALKPLNVLTERLPNQVTLEGCPGLERHTTAPATQLDGGDCTEASEGEDQPF